MKYFEFFCKVLLRAAFEADVVHPLEMDATSSWLYLRLTDVAGVPTANRILLYDKSPAIGRSLPI